MTTPRSNIVRLRLTDLEKKDWQGAAGGARKLSEWIRSVCNEACAERAEQEAANSAAEKLHAARVPLTTPVMPRVVADENAPPGVAKPVIVKDAIEREVRDEAGSALTAATDAVEVAGPRPAVSKEQCPRWMYHRPGVYCGTCKKVIGK